ncbi:MAG: UbiA family prenyltransferase [Ferruginibacter sp.]|nr:UbiA family prenyltransferase [Ferruginibacter sp.]
MPIFWFALSQVIDICIFDAILVFFILHILVYPASNGYNSYMDKDETSIGGIKNPMQPTMQLYYATMIMDIVAILFSLLINFHFAVGVLIYILVSKAYSYRGIRLKKYSIIGFLTVVFFQGAFTFALVYYGVSTNKSFQIPFLPILASALLIGGFYPLTQIYQHQADKNDGVTTISYLLGYKGTFIFTAIIYTFSFAVLAFWFFSTLQQNSFFIMQLFFIPVLISFFIWAKKVWANTDEANFKNTMRMNLIASICTNLAFITLLILQIFE